MQTTKINEIFFSGYLYFNGHNAENPEKDPLAGKEEELSQTGMLKNLSAALTPAVAAEQPVVSPARAIPVPFAMRNEDGQPNIYKVCLTGLYFVFWVFFSHHLIESWKGGPCGGKSTALSILSQRLTSFGFQVYLVPEAATILFTG